MPSSKLVEKARWAFPPVFAVCCAQNLLWEQIPHLQPEKYFLPGTEGELPGTGKRDHPGVRPGRKCFGFCFSLSRKILRSFFL